MTIFSAVLRRGHGEPDGGSEGLWESIALRILVRAWGRVLIDHPPRYPHHDWHGINRLMARSNSTQWKPVFLGQLHFQAIHL